MTTMIEITTNGDYVAEVVESGKTVPMLTVGPGLSVKGSCHLPGDKAFIVKERPATKAEAELAEVKRKLAKAEERITELSKAQAEAARHPMPSGD